MLSCDTALLLEAISFHDFSPAIDDALFLFRKNQRKRQSNLIKKYDHKSICRGGGGFNLMSHVRNIGLCSAGTWVDTVDISLAYARA